MEMTRFSRLNPLANTFVPSNVSGVASEASVFGIEHKLANKETIRSVASYYVQKIIEVKRERREYSLTKSEMVSLIHKLICLQYNISNRYDMLCIRSYLTDRIPNAVLLDLTESDDSNLCGGRSNPQTYRLPPKTFLLVAFYGLYRHEQAFRPMLSLSHRPEVLKDKVWSLTENDMKLWNRSVVHPCGCPPMFGYTIPSGFFGNPFKLSKSCQMDQIHMTCSEDSENSNEYILNQDFGLNHTEDDLVCFDKPIDIDSTTLYSSNAVEVTLSKSDIRYYSDQLESIVSSVYSMIDEFETCVETEDLVDEGYGSCENFPESLWNPNISERTMVDDRIEEDNNNHPLLDVNAPEIEEVSSEVQEMIRRSLSTESDTDIVPDCSPPCSAWCSKRERSQSLQNQSKADARTGLLSETSELITDMSSGCNQALHSRPTYRRSLSADDCYSKYCANTEMFSLMKSHFKTKSLSETWKDTDSGVGTQWSSQEDVFEESGGSRSVDKAPMWNFFSGEDSLWQPLQLSEQSKLTCHKRVRDLKRQTSSSVN